MNTFLFYFGCFFIYSVVGWIIETTLVSVQNKKFIDRGFLIGPYCPIYGYGAILMILYLTQYKDNLLTVFILGTVVCSILEYLTSYIMEILFKTRWWDYSDHKFNLNGRICGQNSCLFGLGGIIVVYITQPFLNQILTKIPLNLFRAITVFFLIIYMIDTIISLNIITKFKKTLTNLDLKKDSTIEFTKMVKETINNNQRIFQKRLLNAFPNINFDKFIDIKNDIKEELEEIKDDIKDFLNIDD